MQKGLSHSIALRLAIASAIVAVVVVTAAIFSVMAVEQPALQQEVSRVKHGEEVAMAAPGDAASAPVQEAAIEESPWEKRWWIEKTARLLRGGEGLSPDDDIESLEMLSKEEIARHFMNDPRFGDTVLDFNMYFLGFKVDSLKADGEYVHSAYDFSNAINSAKALLANEDYLELFNLVDNYYMPPLTVSPVEEDLDAAEAKLPAKELRARVMDELLLRLGGLREMRRGASPISFEDWCDEVEEYVEEREEAYKRFVRAFTDAEIFVLMRSELVEYTFNALDQAYKDQCEKSGGEARAEALDTAIATIIGQLEQAFHAILKFEPDIYAPDTVAEFQPLDHTAFPGGRKWPVFGYEQGIALANSSTNFNRKRAAYVLKRFFCDDLNPVGFDDPKQHVAGAHGTQTSCYSCHYKLDPMAGFFRNYGALFADSSGSPDIVFDDLASTDRRKYLANWKAPEDAERKWDVGYVRSPRWTDQNSYGETLTDLSRIIRNAPEAKRCLMKRMTQYVLGESQTVDGGYLDDLTSKFEKDAAENSSVAFRNALVRVLQSKTYQTRDADPKQCYDYASKTSSANRPPCRVAYILEKNCVQCHSGDNGSSTLDLSKWIDAPDGHGKTFHYLTEDGKQAAPAQILRKISTRLSSNDPSMRMPRNKPMSSQERQELFLWVQKELGNEETH